MKSWKLMILSPRLKWIKDFTLTFHIGRYLKLVRACRPQPPHKFHPLSPVSHLHGRIFCSSLSSLTLKSSMFPPLWVSFPCFSPHPSEMQCLSLKSHIRFIFSEKSSILIYLPIWQIFHTLPYICFLISTFLLWNDIVKTPWLISVSFVGYFVRCIACLFMIISPSLY